MHRIIVPALIVHMLLSPSVSAEEKGDAAEPTGTIVVVVEGARNGDGNVGCAIFDASGKKGFPSDSAAARKRLTVSLKDRGALCTFTGIPTGTYAISVMHDEDRDGELDTKIFGIPTEGWAVSNNHKGKATRGPKFEEAQFKFDGSQMKHTLQLNY